MSALNDQRRVRSSALRVGILVAAASAIVIAIGVGVLVTVIITTAHAPDHPGGPGRPDGDRFVVDVDHILPWVIVLGIAGVVVLGGIAWIAARWAVRPLAEALRLQRNFVSDASHELRTPLTALTSRIQIVQRRLTRGERADDAVAELRRDAKNLDDVLTDMLLTAEGENAAVALAPVRSAVSAAVERMDSLARAEGVTLESRVTGDPVARIPVTTLTRMCVALLDNAIGHSPAGAPVVIDVARADRVVELRVSDRGTGIRPEDLDRIFDRFARGEDSAGRRGFGLGLALVSEAAARHGGSVRVERTSPSGTTFLVTLPAG